MATPTLVPIPTLAKGALGQFGGIGPLGENVASLGTSCVRFERVISVSISVMTIVAGIWLIFLVFSGASSIITSAGEKGKMQEGLKKIGTAVTGLIIVIFAYAGLATVQYVLGTNFLDICTFLGKMTLK